MKILKGILKFVFGLVILALLAAPLYLIWRLSAEEMKQYETKPAPVFRETAFGSVTRAVRMDVSEVITVSGTCVSDAFEYMELNKRTAQQIRWYVNVGDEIREGQALGSLGGDELLSELTGIIAEINAYAQEPYIKVRLLEPVELECFVSPKVLSAIQRAGEDLKTAEGEAVTLTYTSLTKDWEGRTRIRLSIDTDFYSYGMEVSELKLLTGRAYLNTLVLNPGCLYKNDASSEEWYARRVTEDGYFIEEVRVGVGYFNGEVVCVSGVNEGDCFDTGYRAAVSFGETP